jgi:hypothetical protein
MRGYGLLRDAGFQTRIDPERKTHKHESHDSFLFDVALVAVLSVGIVA